MTTLRKLNGDFGFGYSNPEKYINRQYADKTVAKKCTNQTGSIPTGNGPQPKPVPGLDQYPKITDRYLREYIQARSVLDCDQVDKMHPTSTSDAIIYRK